MITVKRFDDQFDRSEEKTDTLEVCCEDIEVNKDDITEGR